MTPAVVSSMLFYPFYFYVSGIISKHHTKTRHHTCSSLPRRRIVPSYFQQRQGDNLVLSFLYFYPLSQYPLFRRRVAFSSIHETLSEITLFLFLHLSSNYFEYVFVSHSTPRSATQISLKSVRFFM